MTPEQEAEVAGLEYREPDVPVSPRQKAWQDLIEVCPGLARLARRFVNNDQPPPDMSDVLFVSLIAILTNPVKREILRAALFELLTPDLVALLKGFLFEDQE